MDTVLSRATTADIIIDPFPHLVLTNAVSDDLATALIEEFPPLTCITKSAHYDSNQRYDYHYKDLRANPELSDTWKEFIQAHMSAAFIAQFNAIFAEHIKRLYPAIDIAGCTKGIRAIDSHETAELLMDAQISVNTPVKKASSAVRTVHVDDPYKLYAGLFYLRHPDDDSKGGDLQLYRYKTGNYKFHGQHVDRCYVDAVKTVPYQRNTFVLLLNSIDSLHGVTLRAPTPWPRYFMNIIGTLNNPLFDIQSRQENRWKQRWRHLKRERPAR